MVCRSRGRCIGIDTLGAVLSPLLWRRRMGGAQTGRLMRLVWWRGWYFKGSAKRVVRP